MKSSSPLNCLGGLFDWDNALKRLHFLNDKAENPNLWEKVEEAKILMRERQHLDNAVSSLKALQDRS